MNGVDNLLWQKKKQHKRKENYHEKREKTERESRFAGTATASHGVQAFIGQLLKSGILVQILFLFHDDFPFFCVVFSSACIYAPNGGRYNNLLFV